MDLTTNQKVLSTFELRDGFAKTLQTVDSTTAIAAVAAVVTVALLLLKGQTAMLFVHVTKSMEG